MITSSVWQSEAEYDAKFGWVLEVRNIPCQCDELRWEQFVTGGFTIYFSDRTSKEYSAVRTMLRTNPSARRFGEWSDDLLENMSPGPRAVSTYEEASCRGGVSRPPANPRATMRGASADPRGARYRFEDAPGFRKNFEDTIAGKEFTGIQWSVRFEHKIWRAGDSAPLHRAYISLTGRYLQDGTDTRRVL